jgi:acetyl esterase/lipase
LHLAGRRLLARVETEGIDDLIACGPWPSLVPGGVFRPGGDLGPLLRILAASEPAGLRLQSPALIVQGSDDPIVMRCRTDAIARSLRAHGATLDYRVYSGSGHFGLIDAAHAGTTRWIDARLGASAGCTAA